MLTLESQYLLDECHCWLDSAVFFVCRCLHLLAQLLNVVHAINDYPPLTKGWQLVCVFAGLHWPSCRADCDVTTAAAGSHPHSNSASVPTKKTAEIWTTIQTM